MKKPAVEWIGVLAVVFIVVILSVGLLGRRRPKLSGCKMNLQRIAICKQLWANESGGTTNDVPSWDDLRVYFPTAALKGIPVCPEGGKYSINRVEEWPTCSIGGSWHSLTPFTFVPEDGASSNKAK